MYMCGRAWKWICCVCSVCVVCVDVLRATLCMLHALLYVPHTCGVCAEGVSSVPCLCSGAACALCALFIVGCCLYPGQAG